MEDITQRTIEEVYDLKDGVFIEANEFFSRPEAEIMAFRKHLEEAIQLNQPRFVCSHCHQMVKISGKSTAKGKVSFFSHLHDSDDCDIKTTTQLSKEEIEARKYGMVVESERHKRLKNFIGTYLENTSGITDVLISKRINSEVPYLNWRCPDVSAMYNGRRLVFELQLSTTFLSVIVDRDIFYRLNNYFVIWVFNFDNEWNRLTLENLLAKDIYYANKRNVFILDDDAIEKSKSEGKLYLSVTWLDENNEFVEKKLVTIEDLSFDEKNSKPYFFDADAVYYQSHLDEQQRIFSLERDRQQVLTALMKKKKDEEEKAKRIQEAIARKREEMREINGIATPYSKNKKWGYEYNDTKLTLPIYSSASEIIQNRYGFVVKNRRKGVVNQFGEEIIPCQYKTILALSNNQFFVDDDGCWGIYKGKRIDKVKTGDVISVQNLNDSFSLVTIKREKESINVLINFDGTPRLIDTIGKFNGGVAKVTLRGKWIPGYSTFNGRYYNYERKKYIQGEKRLLTFNGYWIKEGVDITKDIIPAIAYGGKGGLLNGQFTPISPFEYIGIKIYDDETVKVKKDEKFGLLIRNKETGVLEESIPCVYDELEPSKYGYVKVCNNDKWGVVNGQNEMVVPIKYDSIGQITKKLIYVKRGDSMGACDFTGNEIVYGESSFTKNLIIGNLFGKYGLTTKNGELFLDYKYNTIKLLDNSCIKADNQLYNENGELICSYVTDVRILDGGLMICKSVPYVLLFNEKYQQLLADYKITDVVDIVDDKVTVVLSDKRKGVITSSGEIVPECVQNLSNGMTKQKIFEKWGVKDCNNVWIYPAEYENIVYLEKNNYFILISSNSFSLIDEQGVLRKTIENVRFESQLSQSLLKISSNHSFGVCNIDGVILQQCQYSGIAKAGNKFFITKKIERRNGQLDFVYYGLLNMNGETLIECEKRHIDVVDDYIVVVDKGRSTIYNTEMEEICNYYQIQPLVCAAQEIGLYAIAAERRGYERYGQWGAVTSTWEQIVPCLNDEIMMMSAKWIAYKRKGKWGCTAVDLTQAYPCIYPNICLNENNEPSVKLGEKIIRCTDFVERKRLMGNDVYKAVVSEIRDYGLMVNVEGNNCLLHVSEIKKHGKKISEYNVGEHLAVVVKSFDREKKRYALGLPDNNI